jgi:hypothetical protein
MGLFDSIKQERQNQGYDPRQRQLMEQDLQGVKANPAAFLANRGVTIPDGMTDPRQITQYLLQTKQIGVPRLQQVMTGLGWKPGR